jgi:hypothetical protein
MLDMSPWLASSRAGEPAAGWLPGDAGGGGAPEAAHGEVPEPLPARRLIVALGLFSAISAVAGGVHLMAGSRHLPPLVALAHTPFETFLVPGLLLALVVGASSLACATFAWRRWPSAPDATMFAGGALSVWIIAEVAIMRELHWLHLVFGALGIALLSLGVRAAWQSRMPRQRWVITVTAAEAIGYLAPASAGILSARAGLGDVSQAALVVAAGLAEGLALGAGQAWAFPFRVRRLRYALLTAAGAGTVWLSVLTAIHLAGGGAVHPAVAAGAGLAAGLIGLAAIGTAQWIELRRHTPKTRRWIAWTALAWTLALPLSFTPSPFVDERTPVASHLALWGCGGLLMAYVMALITWQGARRLTAGSLTISRIGSLIHRSGGPS